jgi:acetyl esterase/lipase
VKHTPETFIPPRSKLAPLSLSISTFALLVAMWIVVPAAHTFLWLVAVGASEWSLWFGALGLVGALLGLIPLKRGRSWQGIVAVVLGLLAVAFACYPPLVAHKVAKANDVHLSLSRYLLGSRIKQSASPQIFTFSTSGGQALQLDFYAPASEVAATMSSPSRPAIIVVHGGSWNGGARGDFPQWNRWLAAQGYAVFDVDYRLAPQPNWQTATSDVCCAVRWVKRHAPQLNIDAQRIALLGRSAGAHLALLAAYAHDDQSFVTTCPNSEDDDALDHKVVADVQAVVAFYTPTDLRWAYDNPANERVIDGPATLRRFTGGTPQTAPSIYDSASPVTYVNSNAPPTLLIHGGRDQLVRRENMERLARVLDEANAPHESLLIPYAQHGFDYNFNGWGAQIVQPVMLRFLRAHLGS